MAYFKHTVDGNSQMMSGEYPLNDENDMIAIVVYFSNVRKIGGAGNSLLCIYDKPERASDDACNHMPQPNDIYADETCVLRDYDNRISSYHSIKGPCVVTYAQEGPSMSRLMIF